MPKPKKKKPVAKKPVAKKPVAKKPAPTKPAPKKPAAKKAVAKKRVPAAPKSAKRVTAASKAVSVSAMSKSNSADPALLNDLAKRVGKIVYRLAKVESKRLFGCDGFFADGSIFALIWKTGRIGVKLPEPNAYRELRGMSGSDPWKAGTMEMAHWVLVPRGFHDDLPTLAKWVERAHRLSRIA